MSSHHKTVIAQFSRMADSFATAPQFTDLEALDVLLRITNASIADNSLDVACGAGIVASHFAASVAHATGIDLTPAMLAKARERQSSLNLNNLTWVEGDVAKLPFPDHHFSVVTSRFALHHMADPSRVFQEIIRVCKPHGRIVISDISLPNDQGVAEAFNRIEANNDPSHVSALTETEWSALFKRSDLSDMQQTRYQVSLPLNRLLEAGKAASDVRSAIEHEVRQYATATTPPCFAKLEADCIMFTYPIAVMCATKLNFIT